MLPTFRFCIKEIACNRFKSSIAREARILQKLINKGFTEKKPQSQGNNIISKEFLFTAYENEDCSPRLTVLNKNYMGHINELLNNGKYGRQLVDLEVEVTKVKLSKCNHFLNIYFILKNSATPPQILEDTLSGALAELQTRIGEYRYLGKVPYLKFVRDKMLENAIHLDKVFQDLDFGKDYEPVHDKKVHTEHSSKEDGEVKMRQDIFGVDVDRITKAIAGSRNRYKAINIESSGSDMCPEYDIPEKLMKFNKKDFIKFFKRRRIAEIKRKKDELRMRAAMKSEEHDDEEQEEETEYKFEDYEYFLKDENDEDYMKDKNPR